MVRKELSDFERGTVIGWHLCHKSVREMYARLDVPRSTESAIIAKWKRLGATRSGRPRKLTERGRRVLKRVEIAFHLLHHSLQSTKLPLEAPSAQELGVGSFMEWVSMADQLHTSLTSSCAMPSVGWSGVKHAATGLWSSGNMFFGVMNHASLSGSLMDESGFGGCQENVNFWNAWCLL